MARYAINVITSMTIASTVRKEADFHGRHKEDDVEQSTSLGKGRHDSVNLIFG